MLRYATLVGLLAVTALGCGAKEAGGDDDKKAPSTGGSSSAGASATGGTSSGGSSSGGAPANGGSGATGGTSSPGGAGGGTSGSGGLAGSGITGTCANDFGTPELIIPDTPGIRRQALSITGDDLELYYEERRTDAGYLMVRKRSDRNAAFGDATELDPALWNACPSTSDPGIDVSDDGLRFYSTCVDTTMPNANGGYTSSLIRMAERATRDDTFSLDSMTFGMANVSFSVSQDELSGVYSDYSTTMNPLPVLTTRATRFDAFGPAMPLPGITAVLKNPEFANDGVHLFGSLQIDNAHYYIYMLTRTSDSGGFPLVTTTDAVVEQPGPADDPSTTIIEGPSDYSPTVSGDCKSLYFMRLTTMADGSMTSEIYVAKR